MQRFWIGVWIGAFLIAGCSTGNCRKQGHAEAAVAAESTPLKGDVAVKPTDRVRVFKYDGSLQCNQGKAVAVDVMKKDLKDIQVFSSENKSDSLMRMQQCGTPTGKANVYEIDRKNLDAAKKLGFQLWTFE